MKDAIAFEGEHHTEREKDVLTAGFYFLKYRVCNMQDASEDHEESLDEDSNASRIIPKTKSAFPNRNNDSVSVPLETNQTGSNPRIDTNLIQKNMEKLKQDINNSKISMKKLTLFQDMDKSAFEQSVYSEPDEEVKKSAREALSKVRESFTPQKDASAHLASLQARKSIQGIILAKELGCDEEKLKKVQRLSSTDEDQTGSISARYAAGVSNGLKTPFETKNTFNSISK